MLFYYAGMFLPPQVEPKMAFNFRIHTALQSQINFHTTPCAAKMLVEGQVVGEELTGASDLRKSSTKLVYQTGLHQDSNVECCIMCIAFWVSGFETSIDSIWASKSHSSLCWSGSIAMPRSSIANFSDKLSTEGEDTRGAGEEPAAAAAAAAAGSGAEAAHALLRFGKGSAGEVSPAISSSAAPASAASSPSAST